MIWHIITFDMARLDETARAKLETEMNKLSGRPDILWFQLRRDIERPTTTSTIAIFEDRAALARYRKDAMHVEVGRLAREALVENYVISNVNLEELPLPR
jgi:quinol monooxygenase YgiN